jgi:hypothetical protein
MTDTIHKRASRRERGFGPRALCGRYGFTTHLWQKVTCEACLAKRRR